MKKELKEFWNTWSSVLIIIVMMGVFAGTVYGCCWAIIYDKLKDRIEKETVEKIQQRLTILQYEGKITVHN